MVITNNDDPALTRSYRCYLGTFKLQVHVYRNGHISSCKYNGAKLRGCWDDSALEVFIQGFVFISTVYIVCTI